MKHAVITLKDRFSSLREFDNIYKSLRKHLDRMPMGLPPTLSGVERRLLKAMFNIEEARLALYMDWRFETADRIFEKAGKSLDMSRKEVDTLLFSMEQKGTLLAKNGDGVWKYALQPLVIHMYEMQLSKLTPNFYLDLQNYMAQIGGIEYLTTAIPQMRVIPVAQSITPEHNIGTYDEMRKIIEQTDMDIVIADCICRKAEGLMGRPCKVTTRVEACLIFDEFAAQYIRHDWGRPISKEEAIAHLLLSEKEGLVLQPSNEKKPEFVCFCCGCCCGIIQMLSFMPRPADFVASNFFAALDTSSCNGCGKCTRRCQMNAIEIKDKKAVLNTGKCRFCGAPPPAPGSGSWLRQSGSATAAPGRCAVRAVGGC